MKRNLELRIPVTGLGPAGAKQAFEITLSSFHGLEWICEAVDGAIQYGFTAEYDTVKSIGESALSLFPSAPGVDWLDVGAGLHFHQDRTTRVRTTGDDR